MEKQVGCLVEKKLLVIVLRFYHQFNRFFPNFLGNFIDSRVKQLSHIRLFILAFFPLIDDILLVVEKILGMVAFAPAGIGARMAGWSQRPGLDEQAVIIAV